MFGERSNNLRRAAAFIILFVFWIVFSGHFDTLHVGLGVVCSAVVAGLSYDLLLPDSLTSSTLVRAWRFLLYVPWLLYQVVLANLHVVALVIRPKNIRPQIVRFKTELKSDLAKVTLANSITLTPGTITMDILGDDFYVHAVSDEAAKSLRSGDMERRVAHAFLELEHMESPNGKPKS